MYMDEDEDDPYFCMVLEKEHHRRSTQGRTSIWCTNSL